MVDRNSAPGEFACIWQSKRVGIITIETEKMWMPFSMRRFRGSQPSWYLLKISLYLRKTWPMQAWIPAVSSSLYFWKSIFSFRADSILKSDGDFISNWKFPDCVHFFGARARQAVIETKAVVYELTKRTQEKLFADWTQYYKAFFVPNQEPESAWIFGNNSVRVGTQGLFRPYLKTFVPPFLPTRLTAPGSPRMIVTYCIKHRTLYVNNL